MYLSLQIPEEPDIVTKERFYSNEKTCEQSAYRKDIVTKERFYGNMFF